MSTLPATTYPRALRWLLAELQREIQAACPAATVRITYAPFQNIDAFVEVAVAGAALPPRVAQFMEARFQVAEAEGYTVAVLVRAPAAG